MVRESDRVYYFRNGKNPSERVKFRSVSSVVKYLEENCHDDPDIRSALSDYYGEVDGEVDPRKKSLETVPKSDDTHAGNSSQTEDMGQNYLDNT